MQENIRNYQSLEEESEKLQTRIQALEQIDETYDSYHEFENQERLYRYLIDRSELEIQVKTKAEKQEQIHDDTCLVEKDTNVMSGWKLKKEKLNDEYTAKIADLKSDKASLTIERLKAQKQNLIRALSYLVRKHISGLEKQDPCAGENGEI